MRISISHRLARLRRILATLSVAAVTMTLAACADGLAEHFRPHPPSDTVIADDPGYAETPEDRRPPRALRPDRREKDRQDALGESSEPGEPGRLSGEAPEPDTPPVQEIPATLRPDGREVQMTGAGITLAFGETATVATSTDDGRLLIWNVTVYDKVVRSPAQVPLTTPTDGDGVDHYVCYAYDVTYLGVDTPVSPDTPALRGIPDTTRAPVPAPRMTPVAPDGSDAIHVLGGEDDGCGIPVTNRVPVSEGALVRDHAYARGSIGAVMAETGDAPDGTSTAPPTGVRFDYDSHGPALPASIRWGA
ncbi:Putative secreted protein [Corynebacterium glyciniphilum AJ 3170]|uniref:Putative secreted protein n=1 Tax=Corynebacterium glyciniphilum AJ 3170 TaxID=1404245 RepID=X5DP04_9CORY|nr:hypothetical protein [Corynebacterium glyciniphilum]AHW63034.1 Putative secreted protein [Corynebacterium glyciniphilum AJ 3170]